MSKSGEFLHTAVIGTQWGDEGKGKVIDHLTPEHHVVVRFQGGANAGHTVYVGEQKFVLHHLPSGVLYSEKTVVLGNGMVVDPVALVAEIDELEAIVGSSHANILISERAHVLLQKHKDIDLGKESAKPENERIGTTGKGIGPCYTDKVSRDGVRFCDIDSLSGPIPSGVIERLKPMITDTGDFLYSAMDNGLRILFEGAQATMLDINHGTYPFVTSSDTTIGGVFTGSGVFTRDIKVIGVVKAYTTRVGKGPFPTELEDAVGDRLRRAGGEYGATTGRERRCGWLDPIVVNYSKRVNGLDAIALTKLDVLSGIDPIKVCTGYRISDNTFFLLDHHESQEFPASSQELGCAEPIYREVPGWLDMINGSTRFGDLPKSARAYVDIIEEMTSLPVEYIGTGPERNHMIVRR